MPANRILTSASIFPACDLTNCHADNENPESDSANIYCDNANHNMNSVNLHLVSAIPYIVSDNLPVDSANLQVDNDNLSVNNANHHDDSANQDIYTEFLYKNRNKSCTFLTILPLLQSSYYSRVQRSEINVKKPIPFLHK